MRQGDGVGGDVENAEGRYSDTAYPTATGTNCPLRGYLLRGVRVTERHARGLSPRR